jgi:hypothetical protein
MKPLPPRIIPYPVKLATSRATTGKRLFTEGGDGRSAWGRRWRDLCLSNAYFCGGPELLSEAQVSLIKRASTLECECECVEARRSAGQAVDLELYGRLTSLLCRTLALLGTRRYAPPLDPTSALARALEAYPATAIDDSDEDEPPPIEEPGEA